MSKTIRVALIAGVIGAILGSLVCVLVLGTTFKPVENYDNLEDVLPAAAPTPTWHEIIRIGESWESLSMNEKEEYRSETCRKDFKVSSDEWRISWKTITHESENGYGEMGLTIWVYDALDKACIETIESSSRRDKDSYNFRGSGSYVIGIFSCQAYEVVIEEKY